MGSREHQVKNAEVIALPTPPEFDLWEQLELAERRVEYLKRELGILGVEKGLEG